MGPLLYDTKLDSLWGAWANSGHGLTGHGGLQEDREGRVLSPASFLEKGRAVHDHRDEAFRLASITNLL